MPKLEQPVDLLVCRVCGKGARFLEYEILGSCVNSVFCPNCNSEIDSITGLKHKFCEECVTKLDPLFNLMGNLVNDYWNSLTIVEKVTDHVKD